MDCLTICSTIGRIRLAREQRSCEAAKAADSVFHALVPVMPGAQTKAIAKAPAGRKDVTGCEANALLERLVKKRARVEASWQFELLALMERRSPEAILFVDETYREAAYGEDPVADSFAALDTRIVTGASVSKALGAPGLRTGWLTVADSGLRARLTVAKMNTVISGSVLDETLATVVLRHRDDVLAPRRQLLAGALRELAHWCESERERIEWVRPDAGALCCVRLRSETFAEAAVSRFWDLLPGRDLQLASGAWFGESSRVFRLGFGYLPPARLEPALSALSSALDAATA